MKLPPQLGHTSPRISLTQLRQNVHSKLQIRASVESAGKGFAQCSQMGLSSSMESRIIYRAALADRISKCDHGQGSRPGRGGAAEFFDGTGEGVSLHNTKN